jgi:hypothetical protein
MRISDLSAPQAQNPMPQVGWEKEKESGPNEFESGRLGSTNPGADGVRVVNSAKNGNHEQNGRALKEIPLHFDLLHRFASLSVRYTRLD